MTEMNRIEFWDKVESWLFDLDESNIGNKKYGAKLVEFKAIGKASLRPRRYIVLIKGKHYKIQWTIIDKWSDPEEVEQKTITVWGTVNDQS